MALGATLKVKMDTSEVGRGLAGMKSKISRAFGTIRKVGLAAFGAIAAAGGALAALTINATKFSTSVQTMALQTGMTVHEVLALQNAFKMVDVDIDQASSLITEFKKRLAEAETGTGEAVIGLEAVGISLKELGSMTTMQAFTRVMDGVRGVGTSSDKAKLILDKLFGGAGMENLSVLSERFGELMEEANKNTKSLAFHMKDASKFDAMNMGLARLSVMLRELQIRFVNALPLDRFKEMMDTVDLDGFTDKLTSEMEKFFKEPEATMTRWALDLGMLIGEGIVKGIVQFLTSAEGLKTLGKAAIKPITMPFESAGGILKSGIEEHKKKTPEERREGGFNWPLFEKIGDRWNELHKEAGRALGFGASAGVGEELIRQGDEANRLLARITIPAFGGTA
jgi:hypothetical protein